MIKKTKFELEIDRLKDKTEEMLNIVDGKPTKLPEGYKICKSCARDVVVGEKQCMCSGLLFIEKFVRKVS